MNGTSLDLIYSQTRSEDQFERGLNFINLFSGVEKAPSFSTTGTAILVPGLWSLRWPVIQAFSVLSLRRNGTTLRIPQHSLCPSL